MKHLTSDTHFFDERLSNWIKRPFNSIDEMNQTIIERWNQNVDREDVVFHLGDVGCAKFKQLRKIIKRLNGYKILYMGHHDIRVQNPQQYWKNIGFDEVFLPKRIGFLKPNLLLNHYPIQCAHLQYNDNPSKTLKAVIDNNINDIDLTKPLYSIHGHIHKMKSNYTLKILETQRINIGMDFNNFTPVSLQNIIKIISGGI